jgi:very-short-patch-repair endonuclease
VTVDPVGLLLRTAEGQHGLVTRQQADAMLGPGRTRSWTSRGRLVRVQPAVLRVAGSPRTWHQDLMAAQLASGGLVTHRSAAELWGLIDPVGIVEVSVKPPRQPRLAAPAVCHRILDLRVDLGVRRTGLRITDPRRTLVDLGLVLPRPAVGDALSRGLTTKLVSLEDVRWLREALGRQGRNGTGVIGDHLERRLRSARREESLLEARFVDLIASSSLPAPVLQHEVWAGGRFVARVDAAYPGVRLAIELDGYSSRESPEAQRYDLARQNRLVRAGWTILRFTWEDVTRRGHAVVASVHQLLDRLQPAA